MPFEAFVHPCFKQCLQPALSSEIVVVSSEEGLVSTSAGEDIATVAVVEHPATETSLLRLRHFKHGGSKSS